MEQRKKNDKDFQTRQKLMDQLQQHALKSIAVKLEGQLDIRKVQEHVKEDDSWHQVSQRMDCKKVSGGMEVYSQRQMKHLKSDRSLLSAQGSAAMQSEVGPNKSFNIVIKRDFGSEMKKKEQNNSIEQAIRDGMFKNVIVD